MDLQTETTWTWVQVAIEAPFVLFHTSVLLCIIDQIRKRNASFTTPFYYLYCIQSVVDVVHYSETVVFFRLFRIGLLPTWIGQSPVRNGIIFTTVYLNTYQFVSHTTIALNRFRTIAAANVARKVWTGRPFIYVLVVASGVSLPPAILRLTYPLYVTNDSHGFYIVVSGKDSLTYATGNFSTFLYCSLTCIISLYLELRTLFVYRRLGSLMRKKLRSDFRLLLYAMLQFIGQLLMAIYSTLSIVSALTGESRYVSWAQAYHPIIVDILCLSGPICLLITGKALRWPPPWKYLNFCGFFKNEVTAFTMSSEISPHHSRT